MISRIFNRRVVLIGVALGALVGIYFVLSILLKATLTITVDSSASVSIHKNDGKRTRVWSSNGQGSYKVKLSRGTYIVQATKDFSATKHLMSLGFADSQSVDIALEPSLNNVQVFSSGSESIAEAGGKLIQLDQTTRSIMTSDGAVYLGADGWNVNNFALSEKTGSTLRLTSDGYLLFRSNAGRQQKISDKKPVAIDYDREKDQFCALLQDKQVIFISSSDGNVTAVKHLSEGANSFACANGAVAYAQVSFKFDDHAKDSLKKSTIHIIDSNDGISTHKVANVSALELSDDGKNVYFAGSNSLWKLDVESNKSDRIIDVTTSNKEAIVSRGDEVIVFDSNEVWKVSIGENRAIRVLSGKKFSAVSASYITNSGSIAYSIIIGSDKGTYLSNSDPKLSQLLQTLSTTFPYTSPDFTITTGYTGSKVVLKVTILAPIPSSGDMTAFNTAKQAAQNYIASLKLDMSQISVQFE